LSTYNIVQLGDDILREKARLVPRITPNIIKLLDNMANTMYSAKGVGLAAPQVGVSKRVIVVDTGEGLYGLINPEIVKAEGREIEQEGCLSIPGLVGEVARAASIEVKALDRNGKECRIKASGFFARALQHEIDHLDGVLFIDRAQNVTRVNNNNVG
jgi:peptide deformylase